MKKDKDVLRYLREDAQNLEIPQSITPEQIREKLEVHEYQKKMQQKEEKQFTGKENNKNSKNFTAGKKSKEVEKTENNNAGNKEENKNSKNFTAEKIKKELESIESDKVKRKYRKNRRKHLSVYIAAAACLCLLVGTALTRKSDFIKLWEGSIKPYFQKEDVMEPAMTGGELHYADGTAGNENIISIEEAAEGIGEAELLASIDYPEITYEDIYESMFGSLEEMEIYNGYRGEVTEGASAGGMMLDDVEYSVAIPEVPTSDGAANIAFKESAAAEDLSSGSLADGAVSKKSEAEESAVEFGTTNVQTEGVEEADVVKNDGRYLYQKIYQEKDHVFTQAIQIVDTKDGLKEVKRIEGFDNIQEFYIWEDVLVIIENKYLETVQTDSYVESAASKLMMCGVEDFGSERYYHEISFYNIKDRNKPAKIKTFTLKGRYDSSRITDGYFYGFSKFYANPGEGEKDYASYIPLVDGVRLSTDRILLPEENKGNSYLVLTSIDLKNPTKFVDTTAIITDSDMYYVSSGNIYIADSLGFEEKVGKQTNQVSLIRFSYKKGQFALQAKGKVPGNLESSFSMDEYNGNLRMATTVNEYWFEELKDDRTGEIIGNYIADEKQSNALYVLDSNLKIIGKIENLAKDERIYSARFLGETGYFVTFRQTDPLFAVDLKNPRKPEILSELKISGFSEYLHFYGEDRLLGIGMEADEETGSTEGMKLSMFDISDPADVQEVAKLHLSEYYHGEALYNHRAVMISVPANIFGFEAEGHENGNYKRDYLVFSYEDDKFVQKLKIETRNKYGEIHSSRGTFIGDVFYLLTRDGSVRSFDLDTGKELESL